jgi:transcription termination factor Rho
MTTTLFRSEVDTAVVHRTGPPRNPPSRSTPPAAGHDGAIPVSGIIDIRDQRGVVRTTGYAPGPDDITVTPGDLRRWGLRRGDTITGAAREDTAAKPHRDRRGTLVRLDTVGDRPAGTISRPPDFYDQTALYPQQRLRLETEPHLLTTRVIDLLMPIGKGQRALIASPPKAGKTMILQAIAHAVSVNHPDCHLMAVLVDERPEEVTDMRRTIHGEVVASTFDRPPAEHTAVAELAVERAKRLAESGRDVVILLDSITRLGRAYNLAAPSGGRTLTGGIDSGALHAPKRLLGAARNIEDGGSLTIIATALVDTGSAGDGIIFEEFKSTGNAELRLKRAVADRRVFPAVDVEATGTRHDELLLAPDELVLVRALRRALQPQQGTEALLERLRRTGSNAEFLRGLR